MFLVILRYLASCFPYISEISTEPRCLCSSLIPHAFAAGREQLRGYYSTCEKQDGLSFTCPLLSSCCQTFVWKYFGFSVAAGFLLGAVSRLPGGGKPHVDRHGSHAVPAGEVTNVRVLRETRFTLGCLVHTLEAWAL